MSTSHSTTPRRYAECGICQTQVDPDTNSRTDDGPHYARTLACADHAGAPRFSAEAKAEDNRRFRRRAAR